MFNRISLLFLSFAGSPPAGQEEKTCLFFAMKAYFEQQCQLLKAPASGNLPLTLHLQCLSIYQLSKLDTSYDHH